MPSSSFAISGPQILYEDAQLMAVAKPAGMHVLGAEQSVWAWLCKYAPALASIGDPGAPALVHRLDKGTSGLLLAAKTTSVYGILRGLFTAGDLEKWYLALVEGELTGPVEIDLPIGSRYRRSQKVMVASGGQPLRGVRPARTRIVPFETRSGFTSCKVRIYTGMRHQIRAHLAHTGHPLAGDPLYGARAGIPELGERFFLHAHKLRFRLPDRSTPICLECPLPHELIRTLEVLGFDRRPLI